MHKKAFWTVALAILAVAVVVHIPGAETVYSQGGRPQVTPEQLEKRRAIENELQSIAIVERKLMMPMRDGVKIATDVYRPKTRRRNTRRSSCARPTTSTTGTSATAPARSSNELEAVKRGYAFVEMNERGHFFSEGNYDILGPPLTDGDDEFNWIAKQPWSNGKVGTIGCSSTAEWQLAVAAPGHPAFTTMIAQGFGAGVGRVGSVLRTGQLVSRRRGPDAVHHVALRPAEPGAPDVSAKHVAGGFDPRVEGVRSGAATAAGRLVQGAAASAGARHHQGCRCAARHLRRSRCRWPPAAR